MGSKWRTELGLLLAVLLSIAAVALYDPLLRRSTVIVPGKEFHPQLQSDAANGGSSEVRRGPGPGLELLCKLGDRFAYPYCGITLQFDPHRLHGLDLHSVKKIRLQMEYQGPMPTLRILLRNASPAYGIPQTAAESAKYNQIEFNAEALRSGTVEVDLADFVVANWWMTRHNIPPHLSHPEFDNIVALEIATGSGAPPGDYRFVLHKVEYEAQSLSRESWYLVIIGAWLSLALLWLLLRLVSLQKRSGQLARLATTDALTGICNRTGLEEALQQALTGWREHQRPIGFVLIDIDHFKVVNDTHGHQAGDRVLAGIAELVRSKVRSQDLLGRWGGEEFLLVCRDASLPQAVAVAEKLRGLVAAHDFGNGLSVTASFGVAALDRERPLDQLFAAADAALYRAKSEGRNRVVAESG
ncbi:MAG TPA: GGDEF domain-containing protein [Roseateles sp.]